MGKNVFLLLLKKVLKLHILSIALLEGYVQKKSPSNEKQCFDQQLPEGSFLAAENREKTGFFQTFPLAEYNTQRKCAFNRYICIDINCKENGHALTLQRNK